MTNVSIVVKDPTKWLAPFMQTPLSSDEPEGASLVVLGSESCSSKGQAGSPLGSLPRRAAGVCPLPLQAAMLCVACSELVGEFLSPAACGDEPAGHSSINLTKHCRACPVSMTISRCHSMASAFIASQ